MGSHWRAKVEHYHSCTLNVLDCDPRQLRADLLSQVNVQHVGDLVASARLDMVNGQICSTLSLLDIDRLRDWVLMLINCSKHAQRADGDIPA